MNSETENKAKDLLIAFAKNKDQFDNLKVTEANIEIIDFEDAVNSTVFYSPIEIEL